MTDIQIVAAPEEWRTIRADPRFIELMRLARVANSLGLVFHAFEKPPEDDGPRARRERFGALFYTAAMLKEGLHTSQSLAKWLRDLPQYAAFAELARDPGVRELQGDLLDRIRDQLVFHFDREAMLEGLSRFPEDVVVVVASYPESGPAIADTYFDIADDAVLNYLFGGAVSDEEYSQRLEAFMERVADLHSRFVKASHSLIAAGLVELGCKRRRGP
jgi:hypothetical protein